MTVSDIQKALMARGFDPGIIDGVWGRRTSTAVRNFQRSRGLQVDGVVGPITAKALFGDAGAPKAPKTDTALDDVTLVWYQEALRLRGTREAPGKASNPDILQWAKAEGIPYAGDDIAWCGLFVAHCIGATLTDEPLPTNPLGARAWQRFGAPCAVRAGAVAVFWRGSRDGWQGHVGFYVGEDSEAYHVLGGNQSDMVSVARIGKDRLLEFRWPGTVPLTPGGPVKMTKDGKLSTNEA